ncbi:MOSC domain-containing protein [Planomonospora parontospora subsp. parontospora]|uniref:MOSC domain-containing protein n=2 Tax=Planomonospora parontospora TaxID=58119 RepID=A0AA37BIX0_9ACTN|nr:MOSC N-terminal beta barrel domain-containing protein [Planomonospora parontospora]GGK77808.1 MOSC domain-containing protein [Planomonospora parontospora]GII09942.1 MOSC domain-containing protein [Planomonospora parontospora subsp. parontospora]
MTTYRGSVQRVLRWPVKSLRGEEIEQARLDERGMAGDRAYALVDERDHHAGRVLTVRQRAEMLHWRSGYPGEDRTGEGTPTLTAPDGSEWKWDDPGLAGALAESLGTPLRLRAADGQQDRGPTVLVTTEASRAALEEELGAPVDLRRFRPNLHLLLDAPAFAEEEWTAGTAITVGDAELAVEGTVAGPCIRCAVPSWDPDGRERWPRLQKWIIERHANKFGVIMTVARPGTVRRGDPVAVAPVTGA